MLLRLQNSFNEFCKKNKFEINKKQLEILKSLEKFIYPKNSLFNFFSKKNMVASIFMGVLELVKL